MFMVKAIKFIFHL